MSFHASIIPLPAPSKEMSALELLVPPRRLAFRDEGLGALHAVLVIAHHLRCSRYGNGAKFCVVRIIARPILLRFVESLKGHESQRAVKAALELWFHDVRRARWRNSAELKRDYGSASIVSADRVVFNIKGNDYRMVAAIDYHRQIVFIKWIGSHRAYDNINARTIGYGD